MVSYHFIRYIKPIGLDSNVKGGEGRDFRRVVVEGHVCSRETGAREMSHTPKDTDQPVQLFFVPL